jgi:hemolysin activation/secretion protein
VSVLVRSSRLRFLVAVLPMLGLCAAMLLRASAAFAQAEVDSRTDDSPLAILEYVVEGNTVLPPIAIERAVMNFLGPKRRVSDVERARDALERAYRDAGYLTVLVDVPEQQVGDEGLVRLRVIEGRVDRQRVTGARYFSLGWIRTRTPELAPGNVPHFPTAQREIAELNRNQDRQVTPVLRPGTTPGTVEFDLKVEDKLPLHGNVELTNRYSANTTPLRLGAQLRYDNLWQREHGIAINLLTAPAEPDQVNVLSASYVLPLRARDEVLAFYAVRSRSQVAAIGTLNVLGDGDIYGVRWIMPLRGLPNWFHSFTFGYDYKDFREQVNLAGADAVRTPISYSQFSLAYAATLTGRNSQTQGNASLNFGPRNLFGNSQEEFANKRFGGSANYIYLRADLTHTQRLPGSFALVGRLDLQATGQPLISNEQFALGGVDSVRGYLEAEQLGDRGVRGRVELRTPRLAPAVKRFDELFALAFYDTASARVINPLPGQTDQFRLSSAGVGFRARASRRLVAGVDVAVPLRDTARTQSGDWRALFRLAYEF